MGRVVEEEVIDEETSGQLHHHHHHLAHHMTLEPHAGSISVEADEPNVRSSPSHGWCTFFFGVLRFDVMLPLLS